MIPFDGRRCLAALVVLIVGASALVKRQTDMANFDNKTMPRIAKTDPGYAYIGRYCDRSFLMRPQASYTSKKQVYIVKGDFLEHDTEMAFECTVIARMVDDEYDQSTRDMKRARGLIVTTTTEKISAAVDDLGRRIIIPTISPKGAVNVECDLIPAIEPKGTSRDSCSFFIEVNRGLKKYCEKETKFIGVFLPKNGRVVVTIVSLPTARNLFLKKVPSFKCRFRRVEEDGNLGGWPGAPRTVPFSQPGFYFVEKCNEDILLSPDDDVYISEGPTQPFPGRTFMQCTKKIKVTEGYMLAIKCSKLRLTDMFDVPACVSYYQVNGKDKFCQPARVSGTFKPDKENKVTLDVVAGAWDGSRFLVAKPLFECRLVMLTAKSKTGYIVTTNWGQQTEKATEWTLDNHFKEKETLPEKDNGKMSKQDFSKKVSHRNTTIDGIQACGGKVDLPKWGYTFHLQGPSPGAGETESVFDCEWDFAMPNPSGRKDVTPMIEVICQEMDIDGKPKPPSDNGECNAMFEMNNQQKFCQKGNVLKGMFPVNNGQASFRALSNEGNKFKGGKPLYDCTFQGVWVTKRNTWKKPPGTPHADESDPTITAGKDGSAPEWYYGEKSEKPSKGQKKRKTTIKVPKKKDDGVTETMLYINCQKPNMEALEDPCDCKYIVDGTSFCSDVELNGLFPVAKDKKDVTFEFECKGTFAKGNAYECTTFVYDSISEDQIKQNRKLTEPGIVGMPSQEERDSAGPTFPPPEAEPPAREPPPTKAPAKSAAAAPPGQEDEDDGSADDAPADKPSKPSSGSKMEDTPIRDLNYFYISDLVKYMDNEHGKQMGEDAKDVKFGQIGTLAALGQLGNLGPIKVGRLHGLNATPKLSTSRFGGIGDMPLSMLKQHSGDGSLGVLDHLTIGQMVKLARMGVLKRMTIGHVVNIIPVNNGLKQDIKSLAESARYQKADRQGKVTDTDPNGKQRKRINENEIPSYAYHMPKVTQAYDLISLVQVLQKNLYDIRAKYAKEMGLPPPEKKDMKPEDMCVLPKDIDKTIKKLQRNIDDMVTTLTNLIQIYDDDCDDLMLDDSGLTELRGLQLADLAMILTSLASSHFKGYVDVPTATKLRRVRLYTLNRIMLGTLGSTKHILGVSLEPFLDDFAKELCKDPDEIKKALKEDTSFVKNGTSTSSKTKPSDKAATDKPASEKKVAGDKGGAKKTKKLTSGGSDPKAEKAPVKREAGSEVSGVKKTRRLKGGPKKDKKVVKSIGSGVGLTKKKLKDDTGDKGGISQDMPTDAAGNKLNSMTLATALYLLERLMGAPYNPEARNNLYSSYIHSYKLKTDRQSGKIDSTIKKEEQCTAVAKGVDGGALSEEDLKTLNKLLAKELIKDIASLEEEIPWMDNPRKLRVIRTYIGYGAGAMRSTAEQLNEISPNLQDTTQKIVSGVEDMMVNSGQTWAMSLGGIGDPTILSIGSSFDDANSNRKTVDGLLKPLGTYLKWDTADITAQPTVDPILDVIATFINRYGDIGTAKMRYFVVSFLRQATDLEAGVQSVLSQLEEGDVRQAALIYAGAYYSIATKSSTTSDAAKAMLIGLDNVFGAERLNAIAEAISDTGMPFLNHDNVVRSEPASMEQLESEIRNNPLKNLGPLADLMGIKYLADEFPDEDEEGDKQNEVEPDERRKREAAPSKPKKEEPGQKEPRNFDEMKRSEIRTLTKGISEMMTELYENVVDMVEDDQVSLGLTLDIIQSAVGLMTGQIVVVGYLWPSRVKRGASGEYLGTKYSLATVFCGGCGKTLLGVLVDIGEQTKKKLEQLTSEIDEAIESGKGYKDAMDHLREAIDATDRDKKKRKSPVEDFGSPAAGESNGVSSLIDEISTNYYEPGRKRSQMDTIIPGSLASLAKEFRALAPGRVDQLMKRRKSSQDEIADQQSARTRRTVRQEAQENANKGLSKHGLIFVGMDNGDNHYTNFYDLDDLADEAKEDIMNRVTNVMMTRGVFNKLHSVSSGKDMEPITLEVEVPEDHLNKCQDAPMRKVNVTMGRGNEAGDDFKSIGGNLDMNSGDYKGPGLRTQSNGGSGEPFLKGEYVPKSNMTCIEWRNSAIEQMSNHPAVFLPRCNADGSYAKMQSDESSGLFWCVDKGGNEVPGTVLRFQQPECCEDGDEGNGSGKDKNQLVLGDDETNTIGLGADGEEDASYSDAPNCKKERQAKLAQANQKVVAAAGISVPKCNDDGSYTPVQCDAGSKHCWCVTKDGREIPATGVLGGEPKNCKELQQQLGQGDGQAGSKSSWDYLWKLVRKWQKEIKEKMDNNPDQKPYKPKGVLVKLPPSSGFPNSVMFLTQEKTGEGFPSPYDVWIKLMTAENPSFNPKDYELDSSQLKKLDTVTVPNGSGGTQTVPISDVIQVYPFTEDIYNKNNKSARAFETALMNKEMDWSRLTDYEMSSQGTSKPSGIVASGCMDVQTAKKMCFCSPNNDMNGNRGPNGSGGADGNDGRGGPNGSLAPAGKYAALPGGRNGSGKPGSANSGAYGGPGGRSSKPRSQRGLNGGTAALQQTVISTDPARDVLDFPVYTWCQAKGVDWFALALRMNFVPIQFWTRLASITDMSMADLQETMRTDFEIMYGDLTPRACGPGCIDPVVHVMQDVAGGQQALDKVNIGGFCTVLMNGRVTIGKLLFAIGVDLIPIIGTLESVIVGLLKTPFMIVDAYLKDGPFGALIAIKHELSGPDNILARLAKNLDRRPVDKVYSKRVYHASDLPMSLVTFFLSIDGPVVGSFVTFPMLLFRLAFFIAESTFNPFGIVTLTRLFFEGIFDFIRKMWITLTTPAIKRVGAMDIDGDPQVKGSGNIFLIPIRLFFSAIFVALDVIADIIEKFLGETWGSGFRVITGMIKFALNAVLEPFLIIPKMLFFTDVPFFDCLLAVPIALLDLFGRTFRPLLLVIEPMARGVYYLIWGNYAGALKLGISVSREFNVTASGTQDSMWRESHSGGNDAKKGDQSGYFGKREADSGDNDGLQPRAAPQNQNNQNHSMETIEESGSEKSLKPMSNEKDKRERRLQSNGKDKRRRGSFDEGKDRDDERDHGRRERKHGRQSSSRSKHSRDGSRESSSDEDDVDDYQEEDTVDTSLDDDDQQHVRRNGSRTPRRSKLRRGGKRVGFNGGPQQGLKGDEKDVVTPEPPPGSNYKPTPVEKKPAPDMSRYLGHPPLGGYKIAGVTDVPMEQDDSIFGRLVNMPYFLCAAGGPVFEGIARVLGPLFKSIYMFFKSDGRAFFPTKINAAARMWADAPGLISPFGKMVLSLKTTFIAIDEYMGGRVSIFGLITRYALTISGEIASGGIGLLFNAPFVIVNEILGFFISDYGILGMVRLFIREGLFPDPSGRLMSKSEDYWNDQGKSMASGKGGRKKREAGEKEEKKSAGFGKSIAFGFFEDIGPLFSFITTLFSGLLGTVINPRKLLNLDILNLNIDPLMGFVKALFDPMKVWSMAGDQNLFMMASLGGQDPDPLRAIGLDPVKMLDQGIDPARFLTAGLNGMPDTKRSRFGTPDKPNKQEAATIGITPDLLGQVDLDMKKLYEGGLLNANPTKLIDFGIDPFNLINRLLRNSISNKVALLKSSVNFKKMLAAGVEVDKLFAGGVMTQDKAIFERLGIDPSKMSEPQNFAKIGLNGATLASRAGIDPPDFFTNGITKMSEEQVRTSFGLKKKNLLARVYMGFDSDRLAKMGIDLPKLLKQGLNPLNLLWKIPKLLALNKDELRSFGFDVDAMRAAGLNPSTFLSGGISFDTPKMFMKLGLDPEMLLIGLLSSLGLEALLGTSGDTGGSSLSAVFQLASLFGSSFGIIGKIVNMIPILGPLLFDSEGKLTGPIKIIIFDLIGLDGQAGILGFLKKWIDGSMGFFEVLSLLNPINLYTIVLKPIVDVLLSVLYLFKSLFDTIAMMFSMIM